MKNYRKELWFEVPTRRALINITPQVEECLRESGIKEGFVLKPEFFAITFHDHPLSKKVSKNSFLIFRLS